MMYTCGGGDYLYDQFSIESGKRKIEVKLCKLEVLELW
jgi:hypothetical protein